MDDVFKCPKCDHEMVRGFIPDFSLAYMYIGCWAEGQPEISNKVPDKRIPIGAFRCQACGYLEFYADARFGPDKW